MIRLTHIKSGKEYCGVIVPFTDHDRICNGAINTQYSFLYWDGECWVHQKLRNFMPTPDQILLGDTSD